MKHPLALILYKRPIHTGALIYELAKYEPEPLYVFCDAAKNADEEAAVQSVRNAVRAIDWTEPNITERRVNMGLARSIVAAVDYVLLQNETVIVLEDDCLPGPYFFSFMQECLDRYANNRSVISAGGYTMELPESVLTDYPWDIYFFPRIETWGWATWRRAWELYERDIARAQRRALNKGVDLEQGGSDIPRYIQDKMRGKDIWSPGWLLAAYLNDCYCAYPTKSHIQYVGYDGKGQHCGRGQPTPPPTEARTERFTDGVVLNKDIMQFVRGYYG